MSDLTLIESERLRLEGWRPDQVHDLFRLHGDPETARYLTATGAPWTLTECARNVAIYIDRFHTHRMGKLRLIRKTDGAFVGRAGFGLMPPDDEPEIGFALLPEHRGMGYATEAAAALRDWLFRETAWDHFIGFANVDNAASRKVLRAIGMVETHVAEVDGITGQFHRMRRPGP